MQREIEARLETLRAQLRERYGWTHLDVSVQIEGARLSVRGTIAVPRLRARVLELLREIIDPELDLDLDLGPMPVLAWHRLPTAGVELWAEHPSRASRSLATELAASDGPVGLLAEAPPGVLVRARDGTVGWLLGELGPLAPARPLTAPTLPADPGLAIIEAANAYLGTPYLLGGSSFARIDCSGLVSRAFASALGVVLPRNSNDQLAITGMSEACARAEGRPGDLLFMRSRRLGRTHVGIATGLATVIHASRSRGAVLEEPVAEFERDAEWLCRVGWDAIVTWSHGQVGREHVELPKMH